MRKLLAILLITGVFLAGTAAFAEVELFKGVASGVKVGGWGSGTCAVSSDKPLLGTSVLKVTSQGLHQGGRIDFETPVDLLGSAVESTYLEFTVRFTTVQLTDQRSFYGPGFNVTSMPGILSPKMAAYYYQDQDVPVRAKPSSFRVVLIGVDGKSVEACSSIPMNKDDENWFRIAVPISAFGFKSGDSFQIKRMVVATDVPDTFALGQMTTLQDDTPITAVAGEDQEVPVNDTVVLQAEAEGGASQLRYSWNFGDGGPVGEDATGLIATHRYKKAGDYTVTLTVSDAWGIKAPVTSTLKVYVND